MRKLLPLLPSLAKNLERLDAFGECCHSCSHLGTTTISSVSSWGLDDPPAKVWTSYDCFYSMWCAAAHAEDMPPYGACCMAANGNHHTASDYHMLAMSAHAWCPQYRRRFP